MKKLMILATLALSSISVHSQLKVDSVGHIGIGGVSETSSQVKIQSALTSGLTIDVNRQNATSSNNNTGLNVTLRPKGSYGYGIHSLVYTPTGVTQPDYTMGILSETFGGTQGNFALVGLSDPTKHGAGVFGSSYLMYLTPDKAYAGYFWGPTCVDGDLTVSGAVNGVVLGASSSSAPRSQATANQYTENPIGGRLKGLAVNSFYIDKRRDYTIKKSPDSDKYRELGIPAIEEPELDVLEKQTYSKKHFGLNADQLEEVFPDLVYENEDGTRSINYVEMVPILVQAINELSTKIEELEGNARNMKKTRAQTTSIDKMGENVTLLALGQNKPNPFGTATSIDISIPESVQKAFIYVYDLQGKKVDQVDITARGKQSVAINAANLADGMYLYSLIADGKVVETKRMIVEK